MFWIEVSEGKGRKTEGVPAILPFVWVKIKMLLKEREEWWISLDFPSKFSFFNLPKWEKEETSNF